MPVRNGTKMCTSTRAGQVGNKTKLSSLYRHDGRGKETGEDGVHEKRVTEQEAGTGQMLDWLLVIGESFVVALF